MRASSLIPCAVLGLLFASAFVFSVHAGTAADPDITDKANDQSVEGVVPISTQPPAGTTVGLNADLIAAWIEDAGANLMLTIQVQGSGSPTSSSTTTYTFHFEIAGAKYDATATMDPASPVGSGTIKPGGVATGAVAAGDHLIVLTVPKSGVGTPGAGAVLTNLNVATEAKQGGQVPKTITDRAPDSGAGRDVVLGAQVGAKVPIRATITNATVDVRQAFSTPQNGTYLYNWTKAPANVTVSLMLKGTGTVGVRVLDAANATAWSGGGASGASPLASNLTSSAKGKPGTWTISINYTAFKGNLTLTIVERTALTGSTASASATSSSTGTSRATTTVASSSGKGTPLPTWLVLVAVGVALWVRRR